ncbi:hypothetical protein MUP79_10530 [Candidatus Bathyarchaeota archaeon]|nr:hypothetical protein [Candidatus Bathyarchaeota archaeon]
MAGGDATVSEFFGPMAVEVRPVQSLSEIAKTSMDFSNTFANKYPFVSVKYALIWYAVAKASL